MSDAPDDLGIPMKPARSPGQGATVAPLGRAPAPAAVPARPPEPMRPLDAGPRPGTPISAGPLPPPRRNDDSDLRKLIVGREISLSGDISSCDKLIVEGSVEANLQNCREVDIAESGMFKGSAVIDEIDVRGRFEGNLTVHKRLFVRATGRVSGTIRYGQLEVECGGQISGDVQAQSGDESIPEARAAL